MQLVIPSHLRYFFSIEVLFDPFLVQHAFLALMKVLPTTTFILVKAFSKCGQRYKRDLHTLMTCSAVGGLPWARCVAMFCILSTSDALPRVLLICFLSSIAPYFCCFGFSLKA